MASLNTWLPPALAAGGTVLSFMGQMRAASGAKAAGRAARIAAERQAIAQEFEAAQLEQQAGQAIAASQRAAAEERRQAELVTSRQVALAAASGAGASDPTIVNLIARTVQEGAYRAAVALYEGEDRARAMRMAAKGKHYESAVLREGGMLAESGYKSQAGALKIGAVASLISGAGSLYAKYGGKNKPDRAPKTSGLGYDPWAGEDFAAGYYRGAS